ncbi:MAG: rRNA pseudouridine synthase [Bacilli bacterium]|nr:rRNA pseudouridine synthase [Bacilli bacterium]
MIRLDKLLSHKGYGSRKEVKQLIRKGYVFVNDEAVYDDDFKVDEEVDSVTIMDEEVTYSKYVYYMMNKPKNVVSATFDFHKDTVIDLMGYLAKQKIFPVGRLDIDTEGLLLITNDGKLAHNLLSPKKHVDKVYYVEFKGEYKQEYTHMFEEGIVIDDGYVCKPSSFELLSPSSGNITIHEGKFHQVKRMFLSLGMEVTYLKRIEFGNLKLDENLANGDFRELTEEEIELLKIHQK